MDNPIVIDAPTKEEHNTLKENVSNLTTDVTSLTSAVTRHIETYSTESKEQREIARVDKKDLQESMSQLGNSVFSAVRAQDNRRQDDAKERSKFPTAMMSLIFAVIGSMGTVLAWNMTRIEGQSVAMNDRQQVEQDAADDRIRDRAIAQARLDGEVGEKLYWIEKNQDVSIKTLNNLGSTSQYEAGRLRELCTRYNEDIEDLDVSRDEQRRTISELAAKVAALEAEEKRTIEYLKMIDEKGSRKLVEENKTK